MADKVFQDQSYLNPFQSLIPKVYTNTTVRTFCRTCTTFPPSPIDQVPLVLRNGDLPKQFTYEEVAAWKEKRQITALNNYALSVNPTPEEAVRKFMETYNRQVGKGLTHDELQAYAQKRGLYVVTFLHSEDYGVLTDFSDGHGNFLIYQGVTLKEMMAPDVPPIYIDPTNYGIKYE